MSSKRIHHCFCLGILPVALAGFSVLTAATYAAEPVRLWKATPARPYVLRGVDRRLLDRAEQFVAEKQWEDAIAVLIRLLDSENFSVVAIDEHRLVSLQESCHNLLAKLPAEPLARYRQGVDATAKSWYQQGIARCDPVRLQRVADQFFCSSWGDEALFALGELALQRGDYQAARNAWTRLGAYPDSDISQTEVQARLVLVSVRQDDWERAECELAKLRESFPTATGRLGGEEGVLADLLAGLMKQARQWLATRPAPDWRTFGKNFQRSNAHADLRPKGSYEFVWSQPLDNARLSIFPVVVNDWVIYQNALFVRALHLSDGEQMFLAEGKVFRSPKLASGWLGQSRQTLTASGQFVFGVTTSPLGPRHKSIGVDAPSSLWSLDLQRDGALALYRPSEDTSIAFVGAPIVEGARLYVPIRSNDQMARAGIACYDRRTGERNWQRWLCQANTPATGWTNEIASSLLAYDSGILYMNTNLGAVAAVRADDGKVLWLRTYQRKSAELDSEGNCAYYRGPNPCVYHSGVVVAMPSDSESLLALDATTGEELWRLDDVDATSRIDSIAEGRLVLKSQGLQSYNLRTGQKLGQRDNPQGDLPFTKQSHILTAGEYVITVDQAKLSVYRNQSKTSSRSQNVQASNEE